MKYLDEILCDRYAGIERETPGENRTLREQAERMTENYSGKPVGASGEVLWSAEDIEQNKKDFRTAVNEWVKEGKPNTDRFILGYTGNVLQGLGAKESDIYMLGEKLNTILAEHPEMTLREIKKIPEILDDPVLILKSKNASGVSENTRLVIFGSEKAVNGKPILSVLDLRPIGENFYVDDLTKVTSAYTKEVNPEKFIRESKFLYADKKRATRLLRSIGFRMPINLNQSGYVGRISYKGRIVNIYGKKFSDVFQESSERFSAEDDAEYLKLAEEPEKNAAKLQEMVDAAAVKAGARHLRSGKPMYFYHGTGNDFTVFDNFAKTVHGKMHGLGYYLTAIKDMAEKYSSGRMIKAYIMTDKYAKSTDYNISGKMIEKFIKEMEGKGHDWETGDILNGDYGERIHNFIKSVKGWADTSVLVDLRNRFGEYEDEDTAYDFSKIALKELGYNGLLSSGELVLWDNRLIKSADPVTYDDSGRVIPLSERFNEDNRDIRWSAEDVTLPEYWTGILDGLHNAEAKAYTEKGFIRYMQDYGVSEEDLRESRVLDAWDMESMVDEGFVETDKLLRTFCRFFFIGAAERKIFFAAIHSRENCAILHYATILYMRWFLFCRVELLIVYRVSHVSANRRSFHIV